MSYVATEARDTQNIICNSTWCVYWQDVNEQISYYYYYYGDVQVREGVMVEILEMDGGIE